MSKESGSKARSLAHRVLGSLRRWRHRNQAIRELRAMARWRLADLGISVDQIPAFVDAMLERRPNPGLEVSPTEVQATRTGWMAGPWRDGFAGS